MTSTSTTTPPTRPRLPTLRELIETEEKVREILRARMRRTAPTPKAGSMSPNLKSENLTVLETGHIDGGAYRWLELADGSWRVEEWRGDKWVPGGASFGEFLDNPPVGPEFAAELGIPMADVTIKREKPNTVTAPPKLSKMDLREAIRLGVRLAEEDALFRLTMKARQVRAAEIEERRPHLVINTTLH
jgi:hypothetical protein